MEEPLRDVTALKEVASHVQFPASGPVAVNRINMGLVPINSFADMLEMARWMARTPILPLHLKFGDDQEATIANCLQIVDRALAAGVSPFTYAQECFVIKGKLGISGKMAAAIINARAGLKHPLDHVFFNEEGRLRCTVKGIFADKRGTKEKTLKIESVMTPNPNWLRDQENQLLYATWTAWGRAHVPHLMVGVMTEHDAEVETGDVVLVEPPQANQEPASGPVASNGNLAAGEVPQEKPSANVFTGNDRKLVEAVTQSMAALQPDDPCDFFLGKQLEAEFELFFTAMGLSHSDEDMKTRNWQQSQILAKRGFSCIAAMNNKDALSLKARLSQLAMDKLNQGKVIPPATDSTGSEKPVDPAGGRF